MKTSRVFCIVALAAVVIAGQALAGPLGKGVKAGITYTKVTNDGPAGDSDHVMGFAGGVALSYDLIPGFTLAPELLYVQQGGKYETSVVDQGMVVDRGELTWDLDYIQVPVIAKVSLPIVGSLLPNVFGGPAFAFNVKSDYTFEGGDGEESGEIDDIKSTDLSLIVGIGMKLGAGPAGVNVEVRYNHGLSDINDEGGEDAPEITNRGFQVLAGVSF